MKTQRIVRQEQGSWTWQTPYRVQTYKKVYSARKGWLWKLCARGPKLSLPQIRRDAEIRGLLCGGLHNQQAQSPESDPQSPYNQD